MKRQSVFFLLWAALAVCLILAGCKEEPLRPGEVARVNGRSISLAQLEAARGSTFGDSSDPSVSPSLEHLRGQYNTVLFQLICQELVCEYMEKKGLAITPEELAAEEALIRADYPPDTFESKLVEEGIDIEEWRGLLYKSLTVERFRAKVLRPEIAITPEEIEKYYQQHAESLFIPEQWHFIQIYGPDKAVVDKTSAALKSSKDATQVHLESGVSMRDIRMSKNRLPEDLLKVLNPLAPWQVAPTVKDNEALFHSFVMVEKQPRSVRDASETFLLVEQALVENRLHEAYFNWLQRRLSKAKVQVAAPLIPLEPRPPAPPKGAPEKDKSE